VSVDAGLHALNQVRLALGGSVPGVDEGYWCAPAFGTGKLLEHSVRLAQG